MIYGNKAPKNVKSCAVCLVELKKKDHRRHSKLFFSFWYEGCK
jgi:hypothetical protein